MIRNRENIDEYYQNIVDRYNGIIRDLGMSFDMSGELDYVKNAMKHGTGRDYAASRGEYLNGIILAKYLGFSFIDAESVIFFKDDGSFDEEKTNEVLRAELQISRGENEALLQDNTTLFGLNAKLVKQNSSNYNQNPNQHFIFPRSLYVFIGIKTKSASPCKIGDGVYSEFSVSSYRYKTRSAKVSVRTCLGFKIHLHKSRIYRCRRLVSGERAQCRNDTVQTR